MPLPITSRNGLREERDPFHNFFLLMVVTSCSIRDLGYVLNLLISWDVLLNKLIIFAYTSCGKTTISAEAAARASQPGVDLAARCCLPRSPPLPQAALAGPHSSHCSGALLTAPAPAPGCSWL